jgi:large subunit ribosomal protein L17
MRHRIAEKKLGRTTAHRKALLMNLTCELFKHHRIVTTVEKAKATRPFAEKLITMAREKSLVNVRRAVSMLGNNRHAKDVARHLFDEIAPTFKDRAGGYTRILKLTNRRLGDGGAQAIIELVNYQPKPKAAPAEKKD